MAEHFVVMWLLSYIGQKIDFRQYGGTKGNSITHYLIEFINFILANQDDDSPIAIIACMIDFSKAFNRIDHTLIVTKLSDMGVPGWLLFIVMAFLTDRRMVVRYNGKHSSTRCLPGGGPQGTLLGLLLFLVLINDLGFENQKNNAGELITRRNNLKAANVIHLKYVDDLTIAESINLKDNLTFVPESVRPLPDTFNTTTGHILPNKNSQVYKQLLWTKEYSTENSMVITHKKSKVMMFNPCIVRDFIPEWDFDGQEMEMVEEMRLLGLVVSSDLKWTTNTQEMIGKGYRRLWSVRRLKGMGASIEDLMDIYVKQVRCVLEFAVAAWNGALTSKEKLDIERVQKTALHIMVGEMYSGYGDALISVSLDTLDARRNKL